jgi:hypothetical protein
MKLNAIIIALAAALLTGQALYPTAGMASLPINGPENPGEDLEEDPDLQAPKVELLQSGDYTYYITDVANKKISITKISNAGEKLEIPAEIDGYQVTGVGMLFDSFAYYEEKGYPVEEYRVLSTEDMKQVKSVSFPEGLEQIGTNAFRGMEELIEITLPDSLLKIHSGCFSSTGIKELVLPINLSYISNHAFNDCDQLSKIIIKSKSLRCSDEYPPFAGCDAIEEVLWEKTVESIDMIGFRLTSIKRMVVPETVKTIDLQTVDTLIIKGEETEITCSDAYVREELKKTKVILPKNSAALKGAKELNCKYTEVTLPKAPKITKKLYTVDKTSKMKLSWNKLSGVSKYQIYYSKTKNGTYSKLAETDRLSYTLLYKKGYIKIRAYKVYQDERWYGPCSVIKLD